MKKLLTFKINEHNNDKKLVITIELDLHYNI